jgi:hypothetical protein
VNESIRVVCGRRKLGLLLLGLVPRLTSDSPAPVLKKGFLLLYNDGEEEEGVMKPPSVLDAMLAYESRRTIKVGR